nr:integrase, catalytic region, zinc finger, CCHC-type, peptidase aspartic, catalytic [Tanacetum cinerariifolium]
MISIYSLSPLLEYSCRDDQDPSFELLSWIPATCHSKVLPLCFPIKGIRLIFPNSCVRWLSMYLLCRPIRKKGCATWDGGNSTWGGWAKGFGTILVCVSVQEMVYGGGSLLAGKVVQIIMWIVDSGCSKHMTGYRSLLKNFIENIVRFGKSFCRDDLVTGDRESNLYIISIYNMAASSPVCLMSKATSTKSWLWHHILSHLNFDTINDLTKHDLIDGLLKFIYEKDHLHTKDMVALCSGNFMCFEPVSL